MFSKAKVTEFYCMIDDFARNLLGCRKIGDTSSSLGTDRKEYLLVTGL